MSTDVTTSTIGSLDYDKVKQLGEKGLGDDETKFIKYRQKGYFKNILIRHQNGRMAQQEFLKNQLNQTA